MSPEQQIAVLTKRLNDLERLFLNHEHKGFDRTKPLSQLFLPSIVDTGSSVTLTSDDFDIQDATRSLVTQFTFDIANNRCRINSDGNLVLSSSNDVYLGDVVGLNTAATLGFPHIPVCNGVPTGTPANYAVGYPLPFVYDYANNKLYVYNGSWKSVALT